MANPSEEPEKRGFFSKIFNKKKPIEDDASINESIIETLEQVSEDLPATKREMLYKVASFDTLTVGDVMTPRADIIAVEADTTLGELARVFSENQHSRMPVYGESLDDPKGFVHVKDVMSLLSPDEDGIVGSNLNDKPLPKIKRELVYVPLSMRLPNLLLQMRAKRSHMALVVDEYGGTDGLVTIEDLIEEIFGDIDDEHDDEEIEAIITRKDSLSGNTNSWEVLAKTTLEEFKEETGIELDIEDTEDEIDTLGGLAFVLAGSVPPRGEILPHPKGYELEILDADPRRIKRLIIRKK